MNLLAALFASAVGASAYDPCAASALRIDECPAAFVPAGSPATAPVKQALASKMRALQTADAARDAVARRAKSELAEYERLRDKDTGVAEAYRERWLTSLKELRERNRLCYRLFNETIQDAVTAYNLRPRSTEFAADTRYESRIRSFNAWNPRYSEAEVIGTDGHYRRRTEDELIQEARGKGAVHGGRTIAGTGAISIYRSGMVFTELDRATGKLIERWDPDALALILQHETAHWVYAASRGGSVRGHQAHFESEAFAYHHQARFARRIGRHDLAAGFDRLAARYDEQARMTRQLGDAEAESRVLIGQWLRGSNSLIEGFAEPRTEFEEEELAGRSDTDFNESVGSIPGSLPPLALAPAAPEEAPNLPRAPPEAPGYEYAPRNGAWQLRAIAIRACESPGSIQEQDLSQLYWYPTIRPILDAEAAAQGLSACAYALYWELIGANPHAARKSALEINVRASALLAPPPDDLPERAPSRGCVKRGVWFPDCY